MKTILYLNILKKNYLFIGTELHSQRKLQYSTDRELVNWMTELRAGYFIRFCILILKGYVCIFNYFKGLLRVLDRIYKDLIYVYIFLDIIFNLLNFNQ